MVNSHAPIPNISLSSDDVPTCHCRQSDKKNNEYKAGLSGFTVFSAQGIAKSLFDGVGIDSAWLDAQLLLAFVLKESRLYVQLNGSRQLTLQERDAFWELVSRRLCFEPIAYLIEKKEFFGLEFSVSKKCLIPRPDTEVVVEKCLELIGKDTFGSFIDLCTGSGAIAIALLSERPKFTAKASDISAEALTMAEENAKRLGVSDRIFFAKGDLLKPFNPDEKVHLIVANPPYIGSSAISSLPPSVRDYEPRIALDAGDEQGLYFYQRILKEAPKFLAEQGFLVLEIGFDQSQRISSLVGQEWRFVQVFADLAGRDRGIVLQKA